MTNEEFQKQILEEIQGLRKDMNSMEQRMNSMEKTMDKRMGSMEKRMDSMDKRMTSMDKRVDSMEKTMATKDDLNVVNQRLENLEGQMSETNGIARALLHRTDELDAKFESLLHATATKDFVAKLATKDDVAKVEHKIDALNVRLFQQEADIQMLKKVK